MKATKNSLISIPPLFEGENVEELETHVMCMQEYAKLKRNWENAFQNWSNKIALDENSYGSYGHCDYGVMCDYCKDNSYGRPCVRALNEMLRVKRKTIDYTQRDFEKVWRGE